MKETVILLAVVILLGATGLIQAQEPELHGVVDVTYQSKYIWRGFDVYGDKSAIQPSIDLDLYGTGFGASVTGHRANSSGFEELERWDYNLYYQNALFGEESYATYYRVGWVYYMFPDLNDEWNDLQEMHGILSWPKICPAGIVPTYILVKLWPHSSDSFAGSKSPMGGTASGFAHIFMLDYGLHIAGLVPDIPEHILNLHAELVFNDGVGPGGQVVDHDWSNAVFGVSTDFDLGNNFTFTPGVYHQITMDSSVNDDKDETWAILGVKYNF